MIAHELNLRDLLDASSDVLRPVEVVTPAEFAQKHRVVVGGPFAGRWDNENGPYLVDVMNVVQEALAREKHVVCIKGAQQGVTDALGINVVMWLLAHFGGPILYLTAKDDAARKISRNRWGPVLKTCAPLRRKFLSKRLQGSLILEKRFTDGSLTLSGSQSGLNFISNPYGVIVFDELDSCQDEMPDGADPIATIVERLTALAEGRPVVMIAFAHPTTRARGAAKLYYTDSDQRRAHVACPHCGKWWAPLWKQHVKVLPHEGQSDVAAKRDPSCYTLVHDDPACGAVITDADRLKMIDHVEQRSTLDPELAKTKDWIGVHVWHLFMRKAGSIERLAKKFIAGQDDPAKAIVFDNKVCGDAHEIEEDANPDEDAWRACATIARYTGDKASYYRGDLPEGVALLTAGTDQNSTHLHWTIWAWGVLATADGKRLRCGWLIDWGEVKRDPPEKKLEAADMRPFLDLVYKRTFTRGARTFRVRAVGHDTGWLPDGVYEFADRLAPLGVSMKGGGDTARSQTPLLRWGKKPEKNVQGVTIKWRDARLAVVNTYLAKTVFFRLMRSRFPERGPGGESVERWRIHLPMDVDDELLTHLSSEQLAREKKTLKWSKDASKPNHLLDCSLEAFVLAEQYADVQRDRTAEEIAGEVGAAVERGPESEEPKAPPRAQHGEEPESPRSTWRFEERNR